MENNEEGIMVDNSSPTKTLDLLRITKAIVITSVVAISLLVLYYASLNSYGQFVPSLGSRSSSSVHPMVNDEDNFEVRRVLNAASTKEKTVILTSLNEAWAAPNSIFDPFLRSFREGDNITWLLNHLVVIAVDEAAYARCQDSVRHCYFLRTKQSAQMAHEASFMTPIYLDLMWRRLAFLQTVLSLGYNFLFTDTDVMWFRNPLPHFTLYSDFQTSCDLFNGNPFDVNNNPNNGFVFVRSNNRTINLYKYWVSSRHKYPGMHEQAVFNKIKNDVFIKKIKLRMRFLDTDYFGGLCSPSKDLDKVCTMHANCCVGLKRKLGDLNTILEDWKNYFHSKNRTLLDSSHWRVPDKCKM